MAIGKGRWVWLMTVGALLAACGSHTDTSDPSVWTNHPPTLSPNGTPLPQEGTPIAFPFAPISPDNLDQVAPLARWGKGPVNDIALSQDGQLLAVASSTGVYVYDAQTLDQVDFYETDDVVHGVAFSPDGVTLASDSYGTIRLWHLPTGALTSTLAATGRTEGIAFSPDGELLAVGGHPLVELWQVRTGTRTRVIDDDFPVPRPSLATMITPALQRAVDSPGRAAMRELWETTIESVKKWISAPTSTVGITENMAFSPDGEILGLRIATPEEERRCFVQLRRVSSGRLLHQWEEECAYGQSFVLSADDRVLGAFPAYGITVRRFTGTEPLQRIKIYDDSYSFSPDASLLASTYCPVTWPTSYSTCVFAKIQLWQRQGDTYHLIQTFEPQLGRVTKIVVGADGTIVSTSPDQVIRFWNARDGTVARTLEGHTAPVKEVSFSPDGERLAVTTCWPEHPYPCVVQLRRVADGTLLRTLGSYDQGFVHVALSPDWTTLARGTYDGTVQLSTTDSDEVVHILAHPNPIDDVFFSPGGSILAAMVSRSSGDMIHLWQVSDGAPLATVKASSWSGELGFSPDETLLVSAGHSGLLLWQIPDETPLLSLDLDADDVIFAPDGRAIVIGNSTSIEERRISDGRSVWEMPGTATDLMFTPNSLILGGICDGSICLWDYSAKAPPTMVGHGGTYYGQQATAFSPDGRLVASGVAGGFVVLWGVPR